jgi:hypothetical protein
MPFYSGQVTVLNAGMLIFYLFSVLYNENLRSHVNYYRRKSFL